MMLNDFFARSEFACRCSYNCRQSRDPTVDVVLLEVLTKVRTHFKKPVIITSGQRCPKHNEDVGGYPNSRHLYGQAADIWLPDVPALDVAEYLIRCYPDTLGIGQYNTFTHIDSRLRRTTWGPDAGN